MNKIEKLEELKKKMEEAEVTCNSILKACRAFSAVRDTIHKAADEADATDQALLDAYNVSIAVFNPAYKAYYKELKKQNDK